MSGKKRIALYGGTFDPVHLGHLAVARSVSQIFEIDEFLFVPAWIAPHKRAREVTPALHRYAMLALATQEDPGLRISRVELESPERSYTVETLAHFRSELGDDAELFFVMGADSWSEIQTWKDWERLLTMANHIVITRPGYDIELTGISSALRERIVDTRSLSQKESHATGQQIFITDAVQMEISATDIRRVVRRQEFDELVQLVPKAVADYIIKYGLYRETNES
ncbi:MAG TPA: nicotinate-nucleotide adenylyltransferase [Pyrinomonadaceae bacterium]|nr:nicotinate-nucleotide adenylyltransferase [Pyrinomonadaceae bacterium]